MIKQRKNNKSRFIKIGSLFLITGIGLISFKIISNYSIKYNEGKHIDEFFKEEKEEIITSSDDQVLKEETSATSYSYIGVLEIPSISVKRGFVESNNKYNNVNYNIQILDGSDMPNITNGNFIIAGHSGSGRVSYFKNLNKLNNDDVIYIYYENIKYTYKVVNKYLEIKDGDIVIHQNKNISTLTLTTCSPDSKGNQLVVISELVEKTNY